MSSTAIAQSTERDFASNYLTLLVSGATGTPPNFKRDQRELRGIGIKLPNLPVPRNATKNKEASHSTCKCSFKSIKPPKFNISLEARLTDTIYQVKTALCESPELQGHSATSIKLLLKGKVIQDGSLIKEISSSDDEIKFTAIVAPKLEPVSAADSKPSSLTQGEKQLPWEDIAAFLESKGFEGVSTTERLKKGWESLSE